MDFLMLVNSDNPLTCDFVPDDLIEVPKFNVNLVSQRHGIMLNRYAFAALNNMMRSALSDGVYNFLLISGYRSCEHQKRLYDRKLQIDPNYGNDPDNPPALARPGTSEHQTGLCMDILSLEYTNLDEGFANTPHAKWLKENAHKFGFILRFPNDKQRITKISFEPWHYRYVGIFTSRYIYENNLTLEEFLSIR